jgi:hypothetical protein
VKTTHDVHEADTQERYGPGVTAGEDLVTVEWDVLVDRRLRRVGLPDPGVRDVEVVVVGRRGDESTPAEPGVQSVDGHRIPVVSDRRVDAPPVEVRVAGTPRRCGEVVRPLRRTVALDASADAAFEAASRPQGDHADTSVSTDGVSVTPSVEPVVSGFDDAETSLAVGGVAAAVEPLG